MKPPLPREDQDESVEEGHGGERVTSVEDDLQLSPPEGCCASVLLKLIDTITGMSDPSQNQRIFAWWLVVGRHGAKAMTATYEHDGNDTIRIDVPDGVTISTAYLQQALRAYWEKDPTLPPDTPVVKG